MKSITLILCSLLGSTPCLVGRLEDLGEREGEQASFPELFGPKTTSLFASLDLSVACNLRSCRERQTAGVLVPKSPRETAQYFTCHSIHQDRAHLSAPPTAPPTVIHFRLYICIHHPVLYISMPYPCLLHSSTSHLHTPPTPALYIRIYYPHILHSPTSICLHHRHLPFIFASPPLLLYSPASIFASPDSISV